MNNTTSMDIFFVSAVKRKKFQITVAMRLTLQWMDLDDGVTADRFSSFSNAL
jgi:hypothetical protein